MIARKTLKFPIKFKLTVILSLIVVLTTSLYLYIAFDLYKKDKTAYIYDSVLGSASSTAIRLDNFFKNQVKALSILRKTYDRNHLNTLRNLFGELKSQGEFAVYQLSGKRRFRISSEAFKNAKFSVKDLSDNQLTFIPMRNQVESHVILVQKNNNRIYLSRIAVSSILQIFNNDSTLANALIDRQGILIAHSDIDTNQIGSNWYERSYISEVLNGGVPQGVSKSSSLGKEILVGYSAIKDFGLYVFSEISEEKSFMVIQTLLNKTLYIALFVVSIAVLLSLFISKFLTSPIENLVEGTKKIAQGHFDTTLRVQSNDEVGILSESFNNMAREIMRYTGEMQEKIRMENELNVARLVQSSFFPDEEVILNHAHLASFYQPASECGGDWWGYISPSDDKLILMIADATGHGVPAALSTATANCCSNNLLEIGKTDPSIFDSSARITSFFNKAISRSGGEILMTFFICIIDFNTKKICYTSAGHNPGLLCNYASKPAKQDIVSLNQANGLRLGVEYNTEYYQREIDYLDNSFLILYTDGLVEGKSGKNKNWNTREFYKTIVERTDYSGADLLNSIVSKSLSGDFKFYKNISLDDDLTVVTLYLGKPPQKTEDDSSFMDEYGDAVISTRNRLQNIEAISDGNLSHLICGLQPDLEFEKNLLDNSKVSIDSFFMDSERTETTLTSSPEISPRIEAMLEKVRVGFRHPSYYKIIRTIAIELSTNAIYNAPVDNLGNSKYSDFDRSAEVLLAESEAIELSIACNERYIAVSVKDPFGTLSKKQLIESILRGCRERSFQDKAGGAGLGLFLVYSYSNKIIVEHGADNGLRFTALIHNSKRFKNYKEVNTSFHFLEKDHA